MTSCPSHAAPSAAAVAAAAVAIVADVRVDAAGHELVTTHAEVSAAAAAAAAVEWCRSDGQWMGETSRSRQKRGAGGDAARSESQLP